LKTPAGLLAGNVLALRLNVDFSEHAQFGFRPGFKNLKLSSGPLAGKSVQEVLNIANQALADGSLPSSLSNLVTLDNIVAKINQNYVDGVEEYNFLVP
jgi:hypothetical protein